MLNLNGRSLEWKFSELLRFGLLVLLVILFAGTVALPQTADGLSYRAKAGDFLKYETTRKDSRISEREGESFEMTTRRTYNFSLQAEPGDSLLCFVLTVNKLDVVTEGGRGGRGFQPFDLKAAEGKRLRIRMTPQGESPDIAAIDSIPRPERSDRGGDRPGRGRFGNPLNQLRPVFFQLPARAMKVGDSWTEPYRETDQIGGGFFGRFVPDQKVEGKTKYTVLGEEKKQGLTCLHLKVESTYSRSFDSERQGNRISGESEGETSGEVWFAPKEGILVEWVQNDFSEGTTSFSGNTMPNSAESQYSLKLVEWKPKK